MFLSWRNVTAKVQQTFEFFVKPHLRVSVLVTKLELGNQNGGCHLRLRFYEFFVKLLDSQKKQSHLYLSPNMTCQIV